MKKAYIDGKQDKWPAFPSHDNVFDIDEDGAYLVKTKLKGAFNNEPTSITQFDASNNELPKDFMLTTGSKINVFVTLVVYDPTRMDGSGVSLRLRQVQVIDLAVMKKRSAFDTVEGGWVKSEGFATDFETPTDKAAEAEEVNTSAPKKSKTAVKAKPQAEAKNVEDFNNIDEALEILICRRLNSKLLGSRSFSATINTNTLWR